ARPSHEDVGMKRYVITHPEMGIYLGNYMGLGFFSLLDCVGQSEAAAFPSRETAESVIRAWESHNDPAAYTLREVDCIGDHVDVLALVQAGVPTSMIAPMIEL